MEDITKIDQIETIFPDKPNTASYGSKKQKKKKHYQEAKKHLDELTKIVDEVHRELEEKESPFRICIYQEGDDIFIDVVAIDDSGKARQVLKQDISHTELDDLVQHIKSGRGLILDADV